MPNRWLSVDEIAAHLGVGRDTVYRWIAHRGMPAHKIGRLWKFKTVEVDRWVLAGAAGQGKRHRTTETGAQSAPKK